MENSNFYSLYSQDNKFTIADNKFEYHSLTS